MTKNLSITIIAIFLFGLVSSVFAGPTRSFKMEVVEVDPADGTLVVAPCPDTGRRFTLTFPSYATLMPIKVDREVAFDDVPLDWPLWVQGRLHQKGDSRGSFKDPFTEETLEVGTVFFSKDPSSNPAQSGPGIEATFSKKNGRLVAKIEGRTVAVSRGKDDCRIPIAWSVFESAELSDIKPGMTGAVSYREEPSGNQVSMLYLKLRKQPFASYMAEPEKDAAEPVERIRANVQRIEAAHAAIADRLDRLAPVDMRVRPRLLKLGERPTLTLRAISEKVPSRELTVYPHYLAKGTERGETLTLDWHAEKDAKGRTIHTATLELPAAALGNYLIHWKCDIGGDIEDYWRTYAVVDNSSTVVLLNDCGADDGTDRRMMLENKLPHTYWMGSAMHFDKMLGDKPAIWWATLSKDARQYGIEPQLFFFYTTWDDVPGGHLNFNGDDEQYIREVLRAYKEIWPLYRYPQECTNAGTYAYSNAFSRAMTAEGFESMISVCPTHLLEHEPGQYINTTCIGHFPHYISMQDFRKTGNETGSNPVCIGQWTGQYLRNRQSAECFDCTEPYWLTLDWHNQAGPRGDYGRPFFSRMFHQHAVLTENSRNNPDHPLFMIVGLEFASSGPEARKPSAAPGDRLAVESLVGRVKEGEPVVFATGNAITDYLRRHFKKSPRHVNYFHDYLAGSSQRGGPVEVPDSIDIEDARFRAVFARPAILPEFHYDFAKRWDYPDFGNEHIYRGADWTRNMIGGKLWCKYDITPRIEDWRDLKVSRTDEPGEKTHRITLTVQSPREAKTVPLAIWDIPRQWQPGTDWFNVENAREFIPVIAPQTDNLNGVLVVDLKKGESKFTVEIAGPARELASMDFTIGDAIRMKIWERETHDGRPVTYLWPLDPWGATVSVTVPENRTATAYLTPGTSEQELAAGTHDFRLGLNQWLRLTGLSKEEIQKGVKVK